MVSTPFCADCPDHEACGQGAPCEVVKDWAAFTQAAHDQGRCEFSGMRVTECVASICDCFETPEGAREIERRAREKRDTVGKP